MAISRVPGLESRTSDANQPSNNIIEGIFKRAHFLTEMGLFFYHCSLIRKAVYSILDR